MVRSLTQPKQQASNSSTVQGGGKRRANFNRKLGLSEACILVRRIARWLLFVSYLALNLLDDLWRNRYAVRLSGVLRRLLH
jgi:hypothetical protein